MPIFVSWYITIILKATKLLAKVQTNNHNQQSNETLFDLIKLRMQKQ